MARLGEAYVRVRADLRDYDADLERALKATTDKFEQALGIKLGNNVGKGIADGLSAEIDAAMEETAKKAGDELEESLGKSGKRGWKSFFSSGIDSIGRFGANFATGMGRVLTDGLSGLGPHAAAGLGAGVLIASPAIIAGVGSAVAAGVALGVAGLGVALASQYTEVQDAAKGLLDALRTNLVTAAEPFVEPLLIAFGRIDAFFVSLQARFGGIFNDAAEFIEPLTSGLLGFFDLVTEGLASFTANSDGYIDALADGMIFFGAAIGDVLTSLGELGEDGENALRDVLFAAADIIVFLGDLVWVSTKAYGAFRDLATGTEWWAYALKALMPPLALWNVILGDQAEATEDAGNALRQYDASTGKWVYTGQEAIKVTDAQTKALREQEQALVDLRNAQYAQINSLVAFRQGMLEAGESIRKNGGELNYQTEKGLNNISTLTRLFADAEKSVVSMYEANEISAEQAQTIWEQNVEEIRRLAVESGISASAVDKIFGSLMGVINLPQIGDKFAALNAAALAARAVVIDVEQRLRSLKAAAGTIPQPAYGGGAFPGYADGGLVTSEHIARVGEGGNPEVILPLTNPRRTRELAAQSGLMNILGGDGASIINVYLGNELLDSRMFQVAKASGAASARMLTNTPRMI